MNQHSGTTRAGASDHGAALRRIKNKIEHLPTALGSKDFFPHKIALAENADPNGAGNNLKIEHAPIPGWRADKIGIPNRT